VTTKPERYLLHRLLQEGAGAAGCERLVRRINGGALFVYPTETIYGLGGIATDAVRRRIYETKKRKPDNPLILVAGTFHAFSSYDLVMNTNAKKLAETFWPGNLTLIMRAGQAGETTGIRVSAHPFLQLIAPAVPYPLFSTSANISGEPYVNDPDAIYDLFHGAIDFMIDQGVLPDAVPSTVVDVSSDTGVAVLREGIVKKEKILEILSRQS
jgi:L-threonylcarbamoyladenylate synthase